MLMGGCFLCVVGRVVEWCVGTGMVGWVSDVLLLLLLRGGGVLIEMR